MGKVISGRDDKVGQIVHPLGAAELQVTRLPIVIAERFYLGRQHGGLARRFARCDASNEEAVVCRQADGDFADRVALGA